MSRRPEVRLVDRVKNREKPSANKIARDLRGRKATTTKKEER